MGMMAISWLSIYFGLFIFETIKKYEKNTGVKPILQCKLVVLNFFSG